MKASLLLLVMLALAPSLAWAEVECGTVMPTRQAQVESGTIVWVGEPPEGIADADVEAAIEYSIAQWNRVGCSTASLAYGGRVASIDDVEDGIPILFARPAEVSCFPDGFLGFTVFTCDGIPTPTVYLNDGDFEWTDDPRPFQNSENLEVDLRSAITHELGHVLGLSHLEHPLATMVANYLIDGGQATLAADDKLALCEITPGGSDECASGDDCDGFGSCVVGEDFRVCDEERGSFGDYCSLEFQICDDLCLVTDRQSGVGYCSRLCEVDADCPEAYQCNDLGDFSRCELRAVARSDTGCSVAQPERSASWMLLLLAFISIRARSGSRRIPCRGDRASKR